MNEDWETDWIKELFARVPNVTWCDDYLLSLAPQDNAIIVFNIKDTDRLTKMVRYLRAYEDANIPYGLVHLSDEFYNSDYSIYQYPNCKFVYRNYWHSGFAKLAKVRFFALGYKRGFCSVPCTLTHTTERKFTWCFAGNLKYRHSQRLHGLKLLQEHVPNGKVVIEEGDSFSNRVTGLTTSEYRNMFEQSIFAFCPPGNINIDSFRICEAMECGTIPVTLSTTSEQSGYWNGLFDAETVPWISEPNWEQCIQRMTEIMENGTRHNIADNVKEFWNSYKARLQSKLHADVKENFAL